ncbi:MAG: ATP phosphoribosyltransferase [Acidobacteria bacterium]|nr:ATP phosphoribosyltransferase [Acidobacteriota bacterium]
MSRPLRIALPKGRLLEPLLERLRAAGFDAPAGADLASRRLVFDRGGFEWILVKDADVPVYVEQGAADAGVAGLDQLLEQTPDVLEPFALDVGRCRLMLIAAKGVAPLASLTRPVVATKYPRFTRGWLLRRRVSAEVVALAGSVELAAVLGLAPYIVDLVETGTTIRVHELEAVETIAEIAPRLIVNRESFRLAPARVRELVSLVASLAIPENQEAVVCES